MFYVWRSSLKSFLTPGLSVIATAVVIYIYIKKSLIDVEILSLKIIFLSIMSLKLKLTLQSKNLFSIAKGPVWFVKSWSHVYIQLWGEFDAQFKNVVEKKKCAWGKGAVQGLNWSSTDWTCPQRPEKKSDLNGNDWKHLASCTVSTNDLTYIGGIKTPASEVRLRIFVIYPIKLSFPAYQFSFVQ